MSEPAAFSIDALPQDCRDVVLARMAAGGQAVEVLDVVAEALRLMATASGLASQKAERDFVIALAARQRQIPHPEAILQATAEAVGQRLGADRAGFYRVQPDSVEFGACWTSARVAPLRGHLALEALGAPYLEAARGGRAVMVRDTQAPPAPSADTYARMHAVALASVPLLRDMAWTAGLYLHHAEPRDWTPGEMRLVAEVAELTWDAIERAEALRQLSHQIAQQAAELSRATSSLRDETASRMVAEGQLRQLQKMEAIGQLTGGIAHDFNNMLGVVMGGLDLARRRLGRGDVDIMRFLDAAMDGASRAAVLTQRLLAFSRQQPLSPEALDLNRLISGMAELLGRTLSDAISVETVLAAGLWMTWADAGQLENSLINLAVNARDAMEGVTKVGGGKLTIETTNIHVDRTYAIENDVAEGQYVLLAVTDTGMGMAPAVVARVFEPFFTTKAAGSGTGLGLSQVFGFIRQSGGTIKVYSERGVGTTFKLYLPRFYGEADAAPARRAPEPSAPVPGGTAAEVVLVVEDEERVRHFSAEALAELGYSVLVAASGEEALEVIRSAQPVALLFTDIVMPGMTGRQLVDRARELRPGLRALYTTGFTRNAVVHNGVLDPGTHFLPKPFGVDELALMVRRTLDD